MSTLLDTHALLWFLGNNPKLPKSTKEKIENTESVFVSLASIWEIAIKVNIGNLQPFSDWSTTNIPRGEAFR